MKLKTILGYVGTTALALAGLASCTRSPGPVNTINAIGTIVSVPLGVTGKPRGRLGRTPNGRNLGPSIGKHGYRANLSERNGIVFTCRAGHIDTAHARKTADWTAYLSRCFLEHLKNNKTSFTFKMPEPSQYFAELAYPENWATLTPDERDDISRDVAIELGAYAAYVGSTWHEMITWEGFKASGLISEFFSAFSWEENFSNLLGCRVAARALRLPDRDYDEAVTEGFDEELAFLCAQPLSVAEKAKQQVRGKWYEGHFLKTEMRKRHFDIGTDDGFITPIVVALPECEGIEPVEYPIPTLNKIRAYGFEIRIEMEPVVEKEILEYAYPNESTDGKRINPEAHFSLIIHQIRQKGIELYGPDCDVY